MDTREKLQQTEETAALYLRELEAFSMEELLLKPNEQEWSLGQMYVHLVHTALDMQLNHAEACIAADSSRTARGKKTPNGAAIFAQGSLPPVRITVPSSRAYTPVQPETKDQLRDGILQVITKMRELEPMLATAPSEPAIPHPAFGYLNACEWFVLVEMHLRHHLRQLDRLKQWVATR